VDLWRTSIADIDAVMDHLASAPGVLVDLRDYPNGNQQVLSHLRNRPDDAKWMAFPLLIHPDRPATPASWETEGWDLPVLQPRISGLVAFLTGSGAASYAESVLGLVAHYHLGEIVGATTAGTNGDVARIVCTTGLVSTG